MNTEDIKAKIAEYPLASASLVVALVSFAAVYFRMDVEGVLTAEKSVKDKELQAIVTDENNSRRLADDIKRAKAIREKIFTRAMDFESNIAAQSFFADFVQNSTVKSDGLPAQQSLPIVSADASPLANCGYMIHASADYNSLLGFIAAIDNNTDRAMVVNRVQVMTGGGGRASAAAGTTTSSGTTSLESDIAFRLWGRKGVPNFNAEPVVDKVVTQAAIRAAKLNEAEKLLLSSGFDYASATNPFVKDFKSAASTSSGPGVDVENALNNMRFSIISFMGGLAVKMDGAIPRRVNNEFELKISGKSVRFRIVSIEEDSFTVTTSSGRKIKVIQKK